MLSFTTTDKLSFEVDGKPYVIAYPTVADLSQVAAIEDADTEGQIAGFLEFVGSKTDKRTFDAINKLRVQQLAHLFNAWLRTDGIDSGEEDSSSDS